MHRESAEAPDSLARQYSILVAEDDPLFRKLFAKWLHLWGYEVQIVEDGAAAWRRIASEGCPRLLLLDWMMPGVDGVEICRRLRGVHDKLYSYILVVTSRRDKHDIVLALEAGADDYVTKPVDSNELRARLQVGCRILQLQDELVRSRELLRIQATRDSLTGLLNRRSILEVLQEELARSARAAKPVGLLMLDFDHFKLVNDRHGHQAGDTVLIEVAGRISRAIRSYDKVGRFGGEEFLVVLPDCGEELLQRIAERIRAGVAGTPVPTRSAALDVTVSIGGVVALTSPAGPEALIRAADAALYGAKEHGRNRCEITSDASAVPAVRPATECA